MAAAKKKDPMELWNAVSVTDPGTTKKVTVGRKFTTVCAQSQIKKATELWGAMGTAWGIKDESFTTLMGDQISLYQAILYYPDGELPIHSDIEIMFHKGARAGTIQEDFSKKQATDAMTKGLSKLGFNADIFEGKFDDNKYVQAATEYHAQVQAQAAQAVQPVQQETVQTQTKYVEGDKFEVPYDPAPFGETCSRLLGLNPAAVFQVMLQIPGCAIGPEQTIDTLTKDQEKYVETNVEFFRQQGCAAA